MKNLIYSISILYFLSTPCFSQKKLQKEYYRKGKNFEESIAIKLDSNEYKYQKTYFFTRPRIVVAIGTYEIKNKKLILNHFVINEKKYMIDPALEEVYGVRRFRIADKMLLEGHSLFSFKRKVYEFPE